MSWVDKAHQKDFNPHSRTGSDIFWRTTNAYEKKFQSTLPHRE